MGAHTAVLAFGGNALVSDDGEATFRAQRDAARLMARVAREIVDLGYRVVLTHGNGPQVGNLAYQQEEAAGVVPPQPLSVLGAMTQGQLGHLFVLGLQEQREAIAATAVVSHVVVDADDPEFDRPSKPIGPFFSRGDAERLAQERGWAIIEDAGRGHRRVVPSPEPRRVVESGAIADLAGTGHVVIAAGGGGIPVVEHANGNLEGVDAVIDKDLTAARMAADVGADTLVLITGVPQVVLDYGTDHERPLEALSADEAEEHLRAGQFPAGSMAPKITAAARFVRAGGAVAAITDVAHVVDAIQGRHGTHITNQALADQPGRVR